MERTAITFEYDRLREAEFERRIAQTPWRYPYLVLGCGDRIDGYACASPFAGRAAYDWFCAVRSYLDRSRQKSGLARFLYTALAGRLQSMGIRNLYACSTYPVEADAWLTRNSMQLHAHPGFVQDGRFHRCAYKFDHWYDMIWMEKEIGSPDVPQQPVRFGQLP